MDHAIWTGCQMLKFALNIEWFLLLCETYFEAPSRLGDFIMKIAGVKKVNKIFNILCKFQNSTPCPNDMIHTFNLNLSQLCECNFNFFHLPKFSIWIQSISQFNFRSECLYFSISYENFMKCTNYSGGLLSSLLISFRTISASESRTLRRSLKTPSLWDILYSSSSFWTRFLCSFRLSFSLSILSSFSLRVSFKLRSFLDFFPFSIIGKGSSGVEFS